MTNYKEIIRLHSLGLNKTRIAESCGCARSTVITALHKAEENGLSWNAVKNLSSEEVTRKLYPATSIGQHTVCRTTSGSTRKCRRAASRSACCGWSIANGAAKTVSSPTGSTTGEQKGRSLFMPRMSKRRKEEWALFLNDRNRITYNKLCRKCVHDCIIPPCSKAMLIIPTKYIHS